MSLDKLTHIERPLPNGGVVLVLNTGALIDPESQAMLGALHSRSIGGIRSHLKVLAEKGSENFMSKFYVGYGHKSIGDLGSVSVFIERVSILAAKAIQDLRLYNGQEASTRYIDFTQQPFIDPINTPDSKELLEGWRSFYLHGINVLPNHLREKYPRGAEEKESIYEKAIQARAFDIMRSFLPAGASTNVVWHGPLRVFSDRLPILRHHPLKEVRNIANAILSALLEAHPNSFSEKQYAETEAYLEETVLESSYVNIPKVSDCRITRNTLDKEYLIKYQKMLSKRPQKTELPKFLEEAGEVQFEYLLDFGSFRDIQRHRAVVQRMPLLTTEHGFEQWYLDEMPNNLREEAAEHLGSQIEKIQNLRVSGEISQYYTALGFKTANRLTGNLPALTYLIELRSGTTVHPTLRLLSQKMGNQLEEALKGTGFVLHMDRSDTRFDVKRGTHDIVMK